MCFFLNVTRHTSVVQISQFGETKNAKFHRTCKRLVHARDSRALLSTPFPSLYTFTISFFFHFSLDDDDDNDLNLINNIDVGFITWQNNNNKGGYFGEGGGNDILSAVSRVPAPATGSQLYSNYTIGRHHRLSVITGNLCAEKQTVCNDFLFFKYQI